MATTELRQTAAVRLARTLSGGASPRTPLLPVCHQKQPQKQSKLAVLSICALLLLLLLGVRHAFSPSPTQLDDDVNPSLRVVREAAEREVQRPAARPHDDELSQARAKVESQRRRELEKRDEQKRRLNEQRDEQKRRAAEQFAARERERERLQHEQREREEAAQKARLEERAKEERIRTELREAQARPAGDGARQHQPDAMQQAPIDTVIRMKPSASCRDARPQCAGWARIGECTRNSIYMQKECKRSCGLCLPLEEEEEEASTYDDEDEDEEDEDQLAMQKRKYESLLVRARRIASADRHKACHDVSPECPSWQRLGECMRNPEYMLSECKVSCGVCIDHDADEPKAQAATPAAATQAANMQGTAQHAPKQPLETKSAVEAADVASASATEDAAQDPAAGVAADATVAAETAPALAEAAAMSAEEGGGAEESSTSQPAAAQQVDAVGESRAQFQATMSGTSASEPHVTVVGDGAAAEAAAQMTHDEA